MLTTPILDGFNGLSKNTPAGYQTQKQVVEELDSIWNFKLWLEIKGFLPVSSPAVPG